MIDEDELRALLAEAAESVPPPGRAPQALLDAIAAQSVPPVREARPRRLKVLAAAAAVVAVVAVGLNVADRDATTRFDATGAAIGGATDGGQVVETAGDGAASSDDEGQQSTQYASDVDAGTFAVPNAPSPASAAGGAGSVGQASDSAKVIRTGSLDLEVPEGTFQSTVERITAQTVGLGGYIAESTTSESADSPSGSITVRVPGDSFDQLLTDLRKLGDVQAVSSKGTDVTAQFTDLEARRKALVATRDRLQTVLAEADTVTDILAVQDRITVVQVEIEQVQGEQKLLEDQTEMGTIAITVGEPGAEIMKAERAGDGGLGSAWDDARRRFGDNVETVVSWSGSAAVVLVIGGLGLLLARVMWVGVRRRLV